MSETLHTCPGCDTPNFTKRGLKAHVCKGKRQASLALTGESQPPSWDRARFLLSRIKTAIRLSIAGQILLGMELLTIKTELGFVGRGGDRKSKGQLVPLKGMIHTWGNWCNAELGISDKTADRKIELFEAAKARVRKLGGNDKLAGLLETHPAKLTGEDEKILGDMVNKLVDGESQRTLLEELKIAKLHDTSGLGGPNPKPKADPQLPAEQLAFAFFSKVPDTVEKTLKGVGNLMTSPDYKPFLTLLPLTATTSPDDVSLESLKDTLETALKGDLARMLADITEAIEARRQSIAAA